MGFSTQEFLLFTQELIHFTQEILPLLPKKLRTPYSRNLRVPNDNKFRPMKRTCYSKLWLNSHINAQQRRRVFSHANGHEGV